MNILTFDIEEWFHILDNESTKTESSWSNYESRLMLNVDKIFSILAANNIKATFFCLGWVARKYPKVIRRIIDCGHDIGTHSDLHQLAYQQRRNEFAEDLRCSISSIENIAGIKVKAYRAPGFSVMMENKWVFEVLAKNGIEIDCSVFPAQRAHGGFPSFGSARPVWIESGGIRIKEFPINLFPLSGKKIIFSGGGYFRLIPYPMIYMMMKRSNYVMTYFPPRDFDYSQPIIPEIRGIRRFKSYYGLKGAFRKFGRLITDFTFINLKEAEEQYDWQSADTIRV